MTLDEKQWVPIAIPHQLMDIVMVMYPATRAMVLLILMKINHHDDWGEIEVAFEK